MKERSEFQQYRTTPERKYRVIKRKLLAIFKALEYFDKYLCGRDLLRPMLRWRGY